MKISWNWLNEYCRIPLSAEEAAERLTVTGCEVEDIERPCAVLRGLKVARIEDIGLHPDRNDLYIVEAPRKGAQYLLPRTRSR